MPTFRSTTRRRNNSLAPQGLWTKEWLASPAFKELCEEHSVEHIDGTEDIQDTLDATLDKRRPSIDSDEAFFVCDVGTILKKVDEWRELLPRVYPHFAIKSNPDPVIVNTIALAGLGFDCASKSEIVTVLATGTPPERIVYANPCKQASALRHVRSVGVSKMTFDNAPELHKISEIYPEAELILRLAVDDSQSTCKFNSKFGVRPEEVTPLFELAQSLNLNVVGISFHVGSGCNSAEPFVTAVKAAAAAYNEGLAMGFQMRLLDIGGGFPGTDHEEVTFAEITDVLRPALDEYFPTCHEIIAEPGRFFVAESHTLAVNIIAKRCLPENQTEEDGSPAPETAYYVSDGIYGSFNCVMFDHHPVSPVPLAPNGSVGSSLTKIFGPTCDSIDLIVPSCEIQNMEVGEWLYFQDMGAYTRCAASKFNGFPLPKVRYTCSRPSAKAEVLDI